jgi:hypothetical protein
MPLALVQKQIRVSEEAATEINTAVTQHCQAMRNRIMTIERCINNARIEGCIAPDAAEAIGAMRSELSMMCRQWGDFLRDLRTT